MTRAEIRCAVPYAVALLANRQGRVVASAPFGKVATKRSPDGIMVALAPCWPGIQPFSVN